jgi:hypothetical protein
MADMITWPCGRYRNEDRSIPWVTRLALERKQVRIVFILTSDLVDIPSDIYVVADADGHEMVLKLHRSVSIHSAFLRLS